MFFTSGSRGANSENPEWDLHTGEGDRRYDELVKFDPPFLVKPKVTAAIRGVDFLEGGGHRVHVGVKDVDLDHFQWEIVTWGDTKIWGAAVTWIAYDPRLENFTTLIDLLKEHVDPKS